MELRSARPFWPIRDGLPGVFPPLEGDARADVAVIGGGITGALVAHRLSTAGQRVIVLDRRDVATGSTSASTALLTWEIDVPMAALARLEGRAAAERAYTLCAQAVGELGELAASVSEPTFRPAQSLYLAGGPSHVKALKREGRDRRRLGLATQDLGAADLRRAYGIKRPWGLLSEGCARVDPYAFAHRLLERARRRGTRVHDRTRATRIAQADRHWKVSTNRRATVRARHVIVATGYEATRFLRRPRLVHLHSTYAAASEPLKDRRWVQDLPLVWETARPYLYVRPTSDGRLLVGGADEDSMDARRRDRLLGRKKALLRRKVSRLFPGRDIEIAFAWAGIFGDTTDGLAYVGAPGGRPGPYYALGYGANGIVFAQVAARLLGDLVQGRDNRDLGIFAFGRRALSSRRCPSCTPWSGYATS